MSKDWIASWTLEELKDCLMNSTDKIRFEYGLHQHGRIRYMRSLQGHSVDPTPQNNVQIFYSGLQVQIRRRIHCRRHCIQQRRQTCFFTAVDPMNTTVLTPPVEDDTPRMLLYTLKSGRAHNAVYWLVLWLAISNSIILYGSILADSLVKVVRWHCEDTEHEILYQKRVAELKEAPRIVLKQTALLETAPRKLALRTPVKLVPKIDRSLHGVPQATVYKDQARKQLISNLTRLVLRHPQKKKLKEELNVGNVGKYKTISNHARQISNVMAMSRPSSFSHSRTRSSVNIAANTWLLETSTATVDACSSTGTPTPKSKTEYNA